jgi:hypothetical protein
MGLDRKKAEPENLPATVDEEPSTAARVLSHVLETGSRVQAPAISAYVDRLRQQNPRATPVEIVTKLEKHYLAAVMASGAAVGGAALIPTVGTLMALTLVAGETAVFLEATILFTLSVAEVHGISPTDRERRRTLVLAALAGDDGKHAVSRLFTQGRTSGAWLADGAATTPLPAVSEVNQKLMKYFVKKYTVKRGALMFGKVLPAGIGATIGAIGNRLLGKTIISNTREAFGPAPARWPAKLHVLPAAES